MKNPKLYISSNKVGCYVSFSTKVSNSLLVYALVTSAPKTSCPFLVVLKNITSLVPSENSLYKY